MLLHKYLGSHTLETLEMKRLKVSRVDTFNDPFECRYRDEGIITLEKAKSFLLSGDRHPDIQLRIVQSYAPSIKTEKKAKRYIKNNLRSLAEKYVAGYPAVLQGNRTDWERLLRDSFRVTCFCAADAVADELPSRTMLEG
jgi:hypothetical protein